MTHAEGLPVPIERRRPARTRLGSNANVGNLADCGGETPVVAEGPDSVPAPSHRVLVEAPIGECSGAVPELTNGRLTNGRLAKGRLPWSADVFGLSKDGSEREAGFKADSGSSEVEVSGKVGLVGGSAAMRPPRSATGGLHSFDPMGDASIGRSANAWFRSRTDVSDEFDAPACIRSPGCPTGSDEAPMPSSRVGLSTDDETAGENSKSYMGGEETEFDVMVSDDLENFVAAVPIFVAKTAPDVRCGTRVGGVSRSARFEGSVNVVGALAESDEDAPEFSEVWAENTVAGITSDGVTAGGVEAGDDIVLAVTTSDGAGDSAIRRVTRLVNEPSGETTRAPTNRVSDLMGEGMKPPRIGAAFPDSGGGTFDMAEIDVPRCLSQDAGIGLAQAGPMARSRGPRG